MQRHSLILWSRAMVEDFNQTISKVSSVLDTLSKTHESLEVRYIAGNSRKQIKTFERTHDAIKDIIKTSINKERNVALPQLGAKVSLYTSLEESNSARISLTIGVSNPLFKNTLIVDFSENSPFLESEEGLNSIIKCFKDCCDIFEPFWGCISNNVNAKRFNGFMKDDLPTSVHWINYYDNEMATRLNLPLGHKLNIHFEEQSRNGYFLQLQENPIDDKNANELELQKKAISAIMN